MLAIDTIIRSGCSNVGQRKVDLFDDALHRGQDQHPQAVPRVRTLGHDVGLEGDKGARVDDGCLRQSRSMLRCENGDVWDAGQGRKRPYVIVESENNKGQDQQRSEPSRWS